MVEQTVSTKPVRTVSTMSAEAFDLEAFKNTVIEGAMDTEYPLVPEAQYIGVIKDLKGLVITREDGTKGRSLIVQWALSDETGTVNLEEITGKANPQVGQFINLDVLENGALDMSTGKNVPLGQLRDAVGQNGPQRWQPMNLIGQMAKVTVKHRKDKNDKVNNNVTKVEKV